ncbi:hypothetical protein DFJ73DRAFT_149167 [Zopfochytrium polystomum]|nr:hypothetical protein DFJ73DRAFT_149167 [Zopfochytrium polystomum]
MRHLLHLVPIELLARVGRGQHLVVGCAHRLLTAARPALQSLPAPRPLASRASRRLRGKPRAPQRGYQTTGRTQPPARGTGGRCCAGSSLP